MINVQLSKFVGRSRVQQDLVSDSRGISVKPAAADRAERAGAGGGTSDDHTQLQQFNDRRLPRAVLVTR